MTKHDGLSTGASSGIDEASELFTQRQMQSGDRNNVAELLARKSISVSTDRKAT